MGNESSIFAVAIEDDTVRARRTTVVDIVTAEDWIFVPGARGAKLETLVIVVLVRV